VMENLVKVDAQICRSPMNEFDVIVFVTVGAVFPGAVADEESMQAALAQLSRDDALFACARLNAIVSGFGPGRSVYQRQYDAIGLLCTPQQKIVLSDYANKYGGPDRVMAFFRGQLLELARRVVMYCQNLPGDGETFKEEARRSAFLRAALIASALWERRLFGPGALKPLINLDVQLREFLGAFRKNVEEANGAAQPAFAVARGWLLFFRYLPEHLPEFVEAFERNTGLLLRQYFICAFALMERTFSDHPHEKRIFATDYVPGDTSIGEMFAKFLRVHAQSPEEWAASLTANPNDSGYLALRQRPVLSFSGNRSITLDPAFYLDNITTAPLFHVQSAALSMDRAFECFGHAFEDYATDLLRQRFPSGSGLLHQRLRCGVKGTNASDEAFEVDAILNDITALALVEIKASWIREDKILAEDPEEFLTEVRRKYGYDPKSKERKGVAQVARSVGALMRREWKGPDQEYVQVASVIPVLLVFDARMGAPGLGHFLDTEFRSLLGPIPTGFFVHSLIILTIADLEHMVAAVEHLSLQDVLRAYSSADPKRLSSFHNFIATSPYLNLVKQSPVLEGLVEEFMHAARTELLPSAGPPPTGSEPPLQP
jgi:hypothetical protein